MSVKDPRLSQILPVIRCSDCGHDVEFRLLGEHVCSSAPPMPALPVIPVSKCKPSTAFFCLFSLLSTTFLSLVFLSLSFIHTHIDDPGKGEKGRGGVTLRVGKGGREAWLYFSSVMMFLFIGSTRIQHLFSRGMKAR